ncbi:hypothetical protein ElyMa_006651300 [Elysia marginata]|uniref:Reverse transcriptase domain-containing protein n=1 Tax=Elysia marginata TaxID=1093978 RepID=A0AAV4IMM0_9GAST|nr:hypothetical protein ElyMa_006651300 [Elysia marginata]
MLIPLQTIITDEQVLEHVDKFTYLGSTISNNLYLDAELNVRIEMPAFAWSYVTNGRHPHPKGLHARRARLRFTSYRATYPALQRRLQKRSEDLRNLTSRTRDGGLKLHRTASKDKGGHKINRGEKRIIENTKENLQTLENTAHPYFSYHPSH